MATALGYRIKEPVAEQAWEDFENAVQNAYPGFRDLVQKGIEKGVEVAVKAFNEVRIQVLAVCNANKEVLKHLTLITTKAAFRDVLGNTAVKTGVRAVASVGANEVAMLGAKEVEGATQVVERGVLAKAAATGLTKGMAGNIAAGAMLGSVGGPPGMVVGAVGGFLVWGAGEVGNVIHSTAVKTGVRAVASVGAKEAAMLGAKEVEGAMQVSMLGTTQVSMLGATQVAMLGAKQVAILGAKQVQGVKQVAEQGVKAAATGLAKATNPVGIGVDIAQAGLEYMGMEEVGKKVGKNIAAGAKLGSVGGPPGMVVGALGGFLAWGAGEVGKVIHSTFAS